jgi:hypothetical protein
MASFGWKMAKVTVTFEQLDREHRRERDAERLRRHEITPEALQAENSLLSKNSKVTLDLAAYLKKARR